METLALLLLSALNGVGLVLFWRRQRKRERGIPTTVDVPRKPDALQDSLAELLERSRSTGGRVHIHDVEEVLRRRIG